MISVFAPKYCKLLNLYNIKQKQCLVSFECYANLLANAAIMFFTHTAAQQYVFQVWFNPYVYNYIGKVICYVFLSFIHGF